MSNTQENYTFETQDNFALDTQENFGLDTQENSPLESQDFTVPAPTHQIDAAACQAILNDLFPPVNPNMSFNSNISGFSNINIEDPSFKQVIKQAMKEVMAETMKNLQETVEKAVEKALSKRGNLSFNSASSLSRKFYLISIIVPILTFLIHPGRAKLDKELKETQDFLKKRYTEENVKFLINHPNAYGTRYLDMDASAGSDKNMIKEAAYRYYTNMPGFTEKMMEDLPAELENRYLITYAALKRFVRAQGVYGKSEDFKWSHLDIKDKRLYVLMADDYVKKTLNETGLPLHLYLDSWGSRLYLRELIRNTLPRRDQVN